MPEAITMVPFEGKGLLDLFRELPEASAKRRTEAACNLVRHLLQGGKARDAQEGDEQTRDKGKKQPPGVAAVDAQKVLSMLTALEGTDAVPYDLQYAVNRLVSRLIPYKYFLMYSRQANISFVSCCFTRLRFAGGEAHFDLCCRVGPASVLCGWFLGCMNLFMYKCDLFLVLLQSILLLLQSILV